jgi:L-2-hydroxyglutarate oxidase
MIRRGYPARIRKYCTQLTLNDLKPHPLGIRAQAVTRRGRIGAQLSVCRKPTLAACLQCPPSPAATSAIPIGAYLFDKATDHFGL